MGTRLAVISSGAVGKTNPALASPRPALRPEPETGHLLGSQFASVSNEGGPSGAVLTPENAPHIVLDPESCTQ